MPVVNKTRPLTFASPTEAAITSHNVVRVALNQAVILLANRVPQSIVGELLNWVWPYKDWLSGADGQNREINICAFMAWNPWNHQVRPTMQMLHF